MSPSVGRKSYPPLWRRIFLSTVLIVIASIGIAFGVGVLLTRNAVETANIDGLNRQLAHSRDPHVD